MFVGNPFLHYPHTALPTYCITHILHYATHCITHILHYPHTASPTYCITQHTANPTWVCITQHITLPNTGLHYPTYACLSLKQSTASSEVGSQWLCVMISAAVHVSTCALHCQAEPLLLSGLFVMCLTAGKLSQEGSLQATDRRMVVGSRHADRQSICKS